MSRSGQQPGLPDLLISHTKKEPPYESKAALVLWFSGSLVL